MDIETKWIILVGFLIAAGASVGIVAIWQCQETNRTAMEQGYSQQSILGENGAYWVKDGKKLGDTE